MSPDLTSSIVNLPKPPTGTFKITGLAMARSSSGARVACLSKSTVFLYNLEAEAFSVTLEKEIELESSNGWTGIALAGDFLAVWGFSDHKLVGFPCSAVYVIAHNTLATFLRYQRAKIS
jgi:hypothetical protein